MYNSPVVDYTFSNSYTDKPVTLSLKQFSISEVVAGNERKIPYARVSAVRLARQGDVFKAVITIEDGPPVCVSNRLYLAMDQFEDRSDAYRAFLRLLHHNLRNKSDAMFCCGVSYSYLLMATLLAGLPAILVGFIAEFFALGVNSFLLSALLVIGSLVVIFVSQKKLFTKQYDPADIPLQFLP